MPEVAKMGRVLRAAAITLFVGLTVAQAARASTDPWPTANGDLSSRRAAHATVLGARTAARLHLLWRFRLPKRKDSFGATTANPVLARGAVYVQDSSSSVYALDARTGALRWTHRFAAPNDGPNGVAVVGTRL